MKQKIKDFIRRQNEKGRLLWVRTTWRYVRDLLMICPVKSLCNLLYYTYLIIFKGHRRVVFESGVKNGVFYICVEGEGDEMWVTKVPHLRTKISSSLYKRLRNRQVFREYSNTLLAVSNDPILGQHVPSVKQVRRDGGYRSSYVKGCNLIQLRDMVRYWKPLPPDVQPSKVIVAIDELLERLKWFVIQNGKLSGDWALHNLIYEKESARIINTDIEGFFTYQHPQLNANLDYIEPVLSHLKTILQMRATQEPQDVSILKVMSIVAYATESDASYSGRTYPAGYHSLTLRDKYFRGQRECAQRLSDVPYDFNKKVVLDLGCNCGGMLHYLADKILIGIGLDSDSKCVNGANLVRSLNEAYNLHFFTFDLENEPLTVIDYFIPERGVDICFLLSVCMWLKNWRNVISYTAKISNTLLFETNGNEQEKREQVAYLNECFKKVELINSESLDDLMVKGRALFICQDGHADKYT